MCRYDYLIFSVIQFLDLWVRGQKVSEGHRTCLYYLRPWVCSTSDCEFLFSVVESSQKIIMDWLKVPDLNVVINFHPSPCPYSHFKLHQALLSWWNFKTTTISDILNYDKKKNSLSIIWRKIQSSSNIYSQPKLFLNICAIPLWHRWQNTY